MDGCPLGLGLVVEDKPTEFSCTCMTKLMCVYMCMFVYGGGSPYLIINPYISTISLIHGSYRKDNLNVVCL